MHSMGTTSYAGRVMQRRVEVDPAILATLGFDRSADRRRAALLAHGLLTEPGPPPQDPAHPAHQLVEIRAQLQQIEALEARIQAIRVYRPFSSGKVGPEVYLLLFVTIWTAGRWFLARESSASLSVGILEVVRGLLVGFSFWAAIAVGGLLYVGWFIQRRGRWAATAKRARAAAVKRLEHAVRVLVSRSFFAGVAGGTVLASRPQRVWLEAARGDLAEARRRRGDDPAWMQRADALMERLRAAGRSIDQAKPDLGERRWTDEGLTCDYGALRAELAALGVGRSPAVARLDDLLAESITD